MEISYTAEAFASLVDVVNYVESMNTLGAGVRWLDKFEIFLNNSLPTASVVKPCNNRTFYELQLRCLNFNDWIIAFSLDNDNVLIEAILHSSRLVD
jgi:hypothetical protein